MTRNRTVRFLLPRIVRCLRDVTGLMFPSISRRPLWTLTGTEQLIALNGLRARAHYENHLAKPATCKADITFGQGFLLQLSFGKPQAVWKLPALVHSEDLLRKFKKVKRSSLFFWS